MSVLSVNPTTTGLIGITPHVIEINTSDTLAAVQATGYLNTSVRIYGDIYSDFQMALVYTFDQGPVWLRVSITGKNISLVPLSGVGSVTSVGIVGSDFTITNSPITSSGNIGLTLNTVTLAKGGTGASLTASNGGIVWSNATQLQILSGTPTAGLPLLSGANATPTWGSTSFPSTVGVNQLLYGSAPNVISGLPTSVNGTLVTSSSGTPSILSGPGTTGNVLQSNAAAAPSFSIATYPVSSTANQLLYSVSDNVINGLTSANNATLITSNTGVPSLSQTLPPAVQTNITALGVQSQALNMGNHQINAVTDPTSAQDAATKNYVDTVAAGLNPAQSVVAATTANLTATYNNGASGVGATLTNSGTQVTFSIDGQSPTITQRVLIKNQTTAANNGIYTVTNVGSGITNWVLTRALDFDTPSNINTTGIVPVINGTVNSNTGWLNVATVTTVGTDPINFVQFGVSYPVTLANGGTSASLTASNGGIFYSTASAGAILSGTATALQILMSGASSAPAWSTATYPATTTASQLLYSNGANTIAGLVTANNGLLVTSNTGVPSILAGPGTTGQILQANTSTAPSFSTASYPSTTTANQVLYSSSANVVTGLATANNGVLLTSSGGIPSIGTATVQVGGTGVQSLTAYGLLFGGTTSTGPVQSIASLGASGTLLQSAGAGALPAFTTATYPATTTANQLLYSSSTNTIGGLTSANNGTLVTSNTGVPSILTGPGTTGNVLQSNSGAAPSFSTATYPVDAALGDTIYGSATHVYSRLTGNTTAVKQYLSQTGTGSASAAPVWATIAGADITGAALTSGNDTNVTLTLGGTPATALLRAASITAGWSGQLSPARGGTGTNNGTSTITIGGNVTFTGGTGATFIGNLTANTSVTFPVSGTLATVGSTVASIAGTANQISASAATGAVTLSIPSTFITPGTLQATGLATLAAGVTVTGAAANIGTDAADFAINIGTAASSGRTITIGNTTGTSGIVASVGTGNFSLDGVGASTYAIGASATTGTITIGGLSQTGTIFIGAGTVARTIQIGSSTGAATINIGAGATNGKTISIGTGAAPNTVSVGSTNTTSTLNLSGGSNGITLNGNLFVTSYGSGGGVFVLQPVNTVAVSPTLNIDYLSLPKSVAGHNLLFNGAMHVWQRGITFSLNASITNLYAYTADRWQFGILAGAGQWQVSRVAGPTSGTYYLQLQRTSGNSNVAPGFIGQTMTIDMCADVPGQVVTLSFTALCGTTTHGFNTLAVGIFSGTGSTDVSAFSTGFTGSTAVLSQNATLTTTAQTFSFTSSVLGAGVTQLAVEFGVTPSGTAGSVDYVQIRNVQLEVSTRVTNFQEMSFTEDETRCQSFYTTISGLTGNASSTGAVQFGIQLSPSMRAAPTVNATGPICITNGAANITQSSFLITNNLLINGTGGLLGLGNYSGLMAQTGYVINASVNSNVLTFDAELN